MVPLKSLDVSGKTVLVRVDFNVPMNAAREITDDTRIRFVLPTLKFLIDQGAKIVLASHMGRPQGSDPEFSLSPVAERLGNLLNQRVNMAEDCVGPAVEEKIKRLADGEMLLLENLRFQAGEAKNDDAFAAALGKNMEIYVNDAFAVSHRKNASVGAVTRHIPIRAAGFLMEKELKAFEGVLKNPLRPLVAVVGGAKVSSKLGALNNMLNVVDKLIIGGAMANTFLKARGVDVGRSKIEADLLEDAAAIMAAASEKKIKLYLPVDAVAAEGLDADAFFRYVPVEEMPETTMALDIGPASVRLFAEALYDARTIVWNGPMGIFEKDAFAKGTRGIARAIADAHAFTVIGGGDTVSAVYSSGMAEEMSYISTGGGAFLALVEGKTLPGVAALEK